MRRILLDTYFRVKPYVPQAFRLRVRRLLAQRSMPLFSGQWPINQLAGRAPDWWVGWPHGKRFAFVLTHDVEGKKGLARCRELAEMETRSGFRSSFNFVAEGEYETPRSLRDFLSTHGFEVAVHDLRHDGKLYSSRKSFRRHAQRINQRLAEWNAVGFRSGLMLHNFDWLRDLDVLYDASSFDTDPFEPQPDGVNTIFPFWIGRNDQSGYVELPYTLPQDSTLFLVLRELGIETWKRKLDWVASHGGLAMVIVHPDYVSLDGVRRSSEYPVRFYQEFLEYVANRYGQEAWFALPKDVAAYIHEVRACLPIPDSSVSSSSGRAYCPVDQTGAQTPTEPHLLYPWASPDLFDSGDWRLHGRRVAMVTFSFFPDDPRPRRAAEALASKGMKVDLICIAENAGDPRREVLNGIHVLRIPIKRRRGSVFRYGFEYGAFLFISAVTILMRSIAGGYDVVYVHNMPDILVLAGLVPKVFGAKVILDLHDPMPELMTTIFGFQPEARAVRLLKWFEKWSIALADAVVTVNRACARLFTSRSCPSRKMNVIMNSPDERIFRFRPPNADTPRADSPDKPFVILYHGSIVERNGLDLAVDALALVRRSLPNAALRIYGGRTPFLDRVMESVQNRGLEQAVHYLGPKTLEQLVPAIEECNVGIIPNHRSLFTELNTPTRIFEFLSLGKPVIAPRAAGICDYFKDDALIFFELGNAEDLARKIEYAYSQPAEVTRVIERAQAVYQQHSWPVERRRFTRLVTQLVCTEVARVEPLPLESKSSGGQV